MRTAYSASEISASDAILASVAESKKPQPWGAILEKRWPSESC
jgi:hypothetical protein